MLVHPDPSLYSEELAPTPPEKRTWTTWHIAALWIGMVVCVPTYTMTGALIHMGMNWWQAELTILLGNLIVLVPMTLNGHAGTKHGIPFPVLTRASFGIVGAHVPSVLRGLVACGWFGIQTWVGGAAIYQLVGALAGPVLEGEDLPVLGINAGEFVCFLLFWVVQLAILYKGLESIRVFEAWAAPFLIVIGLVLLGWAYVRAGGWGPMLSAPSKFAEGGELEGQFWSVF